MSVLVDIHQKELNLLVGVPRELVPELLNDIDIGVTKRILDITLPVYLVIVLVVLVDQFLQILSLDFTQEVVEDLTIR